MIHSILLVLTAYIGASAARPLREILLSEHYDPVSNFRLLVPLPLVSESAYLPVADAPAPAHRNEPRTHIDTRPPPRPRPPRLHSTHYQDKLYNTHTSDYWLNKGHVNMYNRDSKFYNSNKFYEPNVMLNDRDNSLYDRDNKFYDLDIRPYDRKSKLYDRDNNLYDRNVRSYNRYNSLYTSNNNLHDSGNKLYDPDVRLYDHNSKINDRNILHYDRGNRWYDRDNLLYDRGNDFYDRDIRPYNRQKKMNNRDIKLYDHGKKLYDRPKKGNTFYDSRDKSYDRGTKYDHDSNLYNGDATLLEGEGGQQFRVYSGSGRGEVVELALGEPLSPIPASEWRIDVPEPPPQHVVKKDLSARLAGDAWLESVCGAMRPHTAGAPCGLCCSLVRLATSLEGGTPPPAAPLAPHEALAALMAHSDPAPSAPPSRDLAPLLPASGPADTIAALLESGAAPAETLAALIAARRNWQVFNSNQPEQMKMYVLTDDKDGRTVIV